MTPFNTFDGKTVSQCLTMKCKVATYLVFGCKLDVLHAEWCWLYLWLPNDELVTVVLDAHF